MATYTRRRSTASKIISGVGTIFAVVIAAHVIFILFGANPGNPLVGFVREWASLLALWFVNLFATGNGTLDLVLNYGLAIVFWLVVTGIIARLVSRRG